MESLSSEDKIIAVLITIFFIVCFIFVCLALMKKGKLNIGIKDRNENTIMIKQQTQPASVSVQQDKRQLGGFGEESVNIEQPQIQQNPLEQIPISEPIKPVNIEPIQQIMSKVNKTIESKTLGGKISEVDSTDFE